MTLKERAAALKQDIAAVFLAPRALIALTLRLIPKDVLGDCRQRAKTLWPQGKPKMWRYALPTVAIWVLLIWFVVKKTSVFPAYFLRRRIL